MLSTQNYLAGSAQDDLLFKTRKIHHIIQQIKMFDQSQLVKLVSALNTVLDENKTDLDHFSADTQVRGPIKNALNDKMRVLQSAASVAVNALKQIQELKQEKDKLIDANKNLKQDLFNLCDVNIELEDQMTKLKDQVQLQKEQLTTAQKTQQVLEKEKNQMKILLDQRLSKQQKQHDVPRQDHKQIENKHNQIESGNNIAWKERYNNNVSNIKKQLQQLRKATSDLRKKISQNQNRIKKTLKSKKSRQELFQAYGESNSSNMELKKETLKLNSHSFKKDKCENCDNCEDIKKAQCTRCTQVSQETQQESQMGISRVRKLSSFDQNILNQLVEGLLLKKQKNIKLQQPQRLSFTKKVIKRAQNVHNYLLQKIVKDRIKTGIIEPKTIGKRRRLRQTAKI